MKTVKERLKEIEIERTRGPVNSQERDDERTAGGKSVEEMNSQDELMNARGVISQDEL